MTNVLFLDKIKILTIVLIGGTGFLAVSFHMNYVEKEFAIAYRMLLGGVFIIAFTLFKRRPFPKITLSNVMKILISGLFLYAINYLFVYQAILGLPSGICTLITAAIIIPNAILGHLILGTKLKIRTILGAGISFIGLVILLPGDLFDFDVSQTATFSIIIMFSSLFISSFGTVITSKFMRDGLDFYWLTGLSVLTGGVFNFIVGYLIHDSISWSMEPGHFLVWGYMAFFATAVTFILYMQIVNKFGAGNASYIWIIAPAIALNLSVVFEGMEWTPDRIIGSIIILLGSLTSLKKKPSKKTFDLKNTQKVTYSRSKKVPV